METSSTGRDCRTVRCCESTYNLDLFRFSVKRCIDVPNGLKTTELGEINDILSGIQHDLLRFHFVVHLHVASVVGPLRESLVADGAHVRTIPRVGENVRTQAGHVQERLVARRAGEFPFSGVDDDVSLESGSIDESFVAVAAHERPFAGVYRQMFVQVAALRKLLPAFPASVRFRVAVEDHMNLKKHMFTTHKNSHSNIRIVTLKIEYKYLGQ